MTFADLRQTVVKNFALSADFFGETVQIDSPDDSDTPLEVNVKLEAVPPWMRRATDGLNEQRRGTIDEREWLRVMFSRNADDVNAYPTRPAIACKLVRDSARDPDPRPYTFRGEVVYEGDQHAVYIFERPRRFSQGRGVSSS
jgi:hypothetical protein